MDKLYAPAPQGRSTRCGNPRTAPRCHQRPTDENPQLTIDIDRDKAYALGVSPDQIENTLYSAYGTRQISLHLHARRTSTASSWSCCPNIQNESGSALASSTYARSAGQISSARYGRQIRSVASAR